MQHQPYKRLVMDRRAGHPATLCLGQTCPHTDGMETHALVPGPGGVGVRIAFSPPGSAQHYVLDTGATDSFRSEHEGVQYCVIGYTDIEYMDVDFEQKQVQFRIRQGSLCTDYERQ